MSEPLNPKLVGSLVVDCIPQTGHCPNGCAECFYNAPGFYRTKDYSLFPHPDEVGERVVRVNSGHDSNRGGVVRLPAGHWLLPDLGIGAGEPVRLSRKTLVSICRHYYGGRCFWNTSIARFDFPGPVLFTANGRESLFVRCPANVMAVRIRANVWDLDVQDRLVEHYRAQGVAIVMTMTRYYSAESIPPEQRERYVEKVHVLNPSYMLRPEEHVTFMTRYKGKGVRLCGTPWSSYCVDCGNCPTLCRETYRRLGAAA